MPGFPSEYHLKDFTTEYARTGRSHCHKCREAIPKNSLRLARVVPALTFQGDIEVWYHPTCLFAETWQHPIYFEQIEGVEDIDPDDADSLKRLCRLYGAKLPVKSDAHEGLCVDYAKSRHSECRGCYESIDMDELRLGILVEPPEESPFQSVVPEWHHINCFFNRPDFNTLGVEDAAQFAGYRLIDPGDVRRINDFVRMKYDGEKIPGANKVRNAWQAKEEGRIVPKRSLSGPSIYAGVARRTAEPLERYRRPKKTRR